MDGYLTVSNFVNEVVVVDTSHLPMSAAVVQLLKVGEASKLPTADNIVIRDRPNGWRKLLTDDGLGYDLRRGGFYLRLR